MLALDGSCLSILSPCSAFCRVITCAPLLLRCANGNAPDQIAMQSLEGFILAGGASSRMGTDKSQHVLDGQTFVERVAAALSAVTNAITLVGKRHANVQAKLPTVSDIYEQWGALGGLHAALSACRADWWRPRRWRRRRPTPM